MSCESGILLSLTYAASLSFASSPSIFEWLQLRPALPAPLSLVAEAVHLVWVRWNRWCILIWQLWRVCLSRCLVAKSVWLTCLRMSKFHSCQSFMYTPHTRRRVSSPKQKKSLDHTKYAKNRVLFKVCTEIHTKKSYILLQRGIFSDIFRFRHCWGIMSIFHSFQVIKHLFCC